MFSSVTNVCGHSKKDVLEGILSSQHTISYAKIQHKAENANSIKIIANRAEKCT